ncbi:MAG: hypothetical protein PHR35_11310 [Kiritimatiellae bacterium]|nr:hypothetical protein [Kiritimatiellia bacterium]
MKRTTQLADVTMLACGNIQLKGTPNKDNSMQRSHRKRVWMTGALPASVLSAGVIVFSGVAALAADARNVAPEWRGKTPGTAWLGPDVLWRAREWLIFTLLDEKGGGFRLDLTLRDMNIYMQGERPVLIFVLDPDGEVCASQVVEDDGVVSGNEQYCDGIYDEFQDIRYREYHRLLSPGGTPPGKKRSPILDAPEKLVPRNVSVTVPSNARAGLYRAVVIASWDHWLSLTPDRPLLMGIHPGQGPLYAHKDRLKEAYLYLPPGVKDVGFGYAEEVMPFGWTLTVNDEAGNLLGKTVPRTRYSYFIDRNAKGDSVLKLSLGGTSPGCCLSVEGAPFVLCPDAESARKIHGGVEVNSRGDWLYHAGQKKVLDWALSLKPEDFKVEVKEPAEPFQLTTEYHGIKPSFSSDLPRLLASQDLDPRSPTYGQYIDTGDADFDERTHGSAGKNTAVFRALIHNSPGNTYYQNAALMRRVALGAIMEGLLKLGPGLFFCHGESPKVYPEFREDQFFGLPFRVGWYNFSDAKKSLAYERAYELLRAGLPAEVMKAWRNLLRTWGYGRSMAHSGEATNQWILHLNELGGICKAVNDPVLDGLLRASVERWATPGVLGRIDPDPTPFCLVGGLGFAYACDLGWTAAGYPSDTGFDAEYCNETVFYCRELYDYTGNAGIMERCGDYVELKAHLALPVDGTMSGNITCPTDMSHRTPMPSASVPIHKEMAGMPYVDTYAYCYALQNRGARTSSPAQPKLPWPCLEEGPFVRNFDKAFYFLKTPAYYSIVYGGESQSGWRGFAGTVRTRDGSSEFLGSSSECGYGGRGRLACKLAGLSAVFVRDCGPVLLSNNQDVFYVNNLWSRSRTGDRRGGSGLVIPEYDAAGYVTPWLSFDETSRVVNSTARFQYAPLLWNRTIVFHDGRVDVSVDITATEDVDLLNLCEALPYPALDNRTVRTFRQDWSEGEKLGRLPARTAPPRHREPGEKTTSATQDDVQPVRLRAFDISSPSGAGAAVVFGNESEFIHVPPMTYGIQSLNFQFAPRMRKGERQTLQYTIVPHDQAVSGAELMAMNGGKK